MEKQADQKKIYIAIDLKSFYASVECHDHGYDPLNTNLVVCDTERTEKTICLAVSPALKEYGIPGRARLFEVIERVKEINAERKRENHGKPFNGKSVDRHELKDPEKELDFIAAPPRMQRYIDTSARIVSIYLRFVSREDMIVYSIDEVFLDVTAYLRTYKLTPYELAGKMIREVLKETGITATAGIGTNLYLAKVSMDIVAKHIQPDGDGVRIAELDEQSYRALLWCHRPLTDFWRVGPGTERKLIKNGMFTMGDVARMSLESPQYLKHLFGINSELLIDHAWGYEPCKIKEIKAYVPEKRSVSTGQVLPRPYDNNEALLIVKEMAEEEAFLLLEKNQWTRTIGISIGYDIENLKGENDYRGEIIPDHYGRPVPKGGRGTKDLGKYTFSPRVLREGFSELFLSVADPGLLIRRLSLQALDVKDKKAQDVKDKDVQDGDSLNADESGSWIQMDLFSGYDEQALSIKRKRDLEISEDIRLEKEEGLLRAELAIRKKYGKNALIKGMDLLDSSRTIVRNREIGGHRA